MATRSRIAIKTKEGIKSIYCHWDGYPEGVGVTLKNFYKTPKKVKELIALGSISVLDVKVAPKGFKLDFEKRIDGYTLPYTVRGENLQINEYEDLEDLISDAFEMGEEYLYLFTKGKWYVYQHENKFVDIEKVLQEREDAKELEEEQNSKIIFVD